MRIFIWAVSRLAWLAAEPLTAEVYLYGSVYQKCGAESASTEVWQRKYDTENVTMEVRQRKSVWCPIIE